MRKSTTYECDKCEDSFCDKDKLSNHTRVDVQHVSYKCDKCGNTFNGNDELRKHAQFHNNEKGVQDFNCTKCDKVYGNMSKLRRQDWRSHRQIECNIRGLQLESRQGKKYPQKK
jgi:DNA-directed RNA polymerase subunit RPC12/RpoP